MSLFSNMIGMRARMFPSRLSTLAKTCCLCWISWLAGGETVVVGQQSGLVVTVDHRRFEATLGSLDESWNMTFANESRQFIVGRSELLRWGAHRSLAQQPVILLQDGTRLAAEVREIKEDSIVAGSLLWRDVEIPVSLIEGILFAPSLDPLTFDLQLLELKLADNVRDRIFLRNGDFLEGTIVGAVPEDETDALPIGRRLSRWILKPQQTSDGESLEISRTAMASVIWSAPERSLSFDSKPVTAKMGFRDGSWLSVQRLSPGRDGVRFDLSCGIALVTTSLYSHERLWRQVESLWMSHEQMTNLSELEVAAYQGEAAVDGSPDFEIDLNVLGGRLRTAEGAFAHGIGMHSASSAAFVLDRQFSKMIGEIAIDASSEGQGSVIFRVMTSDDGMNWVPQFESEVVRGDEAAVPIEIDLDNAWALILFVDFADRGDVLDRANWLDLRLVR